MGDSQRSVPPPSFNNSDLKVLGKINGKKASRKNVLGNIDESGPFPQPLPEASHDEAPSSGSLNVSMKSKGKNVDVSLCDESSSFSGPTKSRSDLISSILNDIAEVEGKDIAKVEDVDLDDLMKDMSELLKLREKEIESFGTVPHILKAIRGPFKGPLKGIKGILRAQLSINASVLPALFNCPPIDQCLERCDAVFTNIEKCWHLIKEMYYLASFHKNLRENPEGMQDLMQEATALIFEGARVCCNLIGRSAFTSFFSTSPLEIEGALKDFTERLNLMPIRIKVQMGFRFLSDIERQGRSHLSKGYPTPAVEVKDVNLDDLWEHISELWKLREKGNHEKARSLGPFTWPAVPGLQKLKEIVSFGTDLPIEKIYGAVQAILEEIGRENVATAAPLVVACALERLDDPYAHTEEFWHLVKEMYDLAIVLKRLSESPEGTQDVMQDATSLIVEGARVLSLQGGLRRSASEVRAIRQKLNTMKKYINTEFTGRVLTPIQHQRRSHLSKEYPTHAESGPFSQAHAGAFHDETDFYTSFNVSSKGKNVDVSIRKYLVEDVNLDDLWEAISELRKSREKGNHKNARSLCHLLWPDVPSLQNLKEIVATKSMYEAIKTVLKEIGRVDFATAARLVVVHTLEILEASTTNRETLWPLIKDMYDVASVLTRLSESAEGMQDVMKDVLQTAKSLIMQGVMQTPTSLIMQGIMQTATSLIIGGHLLCSTRIARPERFSSKSQFETAESMIRGKLNRMYKLINNQITQIQSQRRSHLLKEYGTHADNGQVEGDLLLTERLKMYINNGRVDEDLLSTGGQKVFEMKALVDATDHFREDNKVGEGAFGGVYKGTTHDRKQIAVKKMSFTSDKGSPEFLKQLFENEKLLAEVQHRNLVNLLGSCEQESQGFLVYEYLPNGSLDKFLFDQEKRKELDWGIRYKIILGIARGLQYLHEDSRVRIVHRDIKASNILLDAELIPKIADFGTANLFPEDRTHVTATSAAGTFGYMPPEYVMTGRLSVRTDVYSFGIVLLELLTGEKISSDALKLLGWVWRSYKRKEVLKTIDPTIIETWDKEKGKALRCIQVALLCVQENSSDRPTMSEVTAMLSTYKSLPVPKKPPVSTSPTSVSFVTLLVPNRKFDVLNL